ncbi:universal stress protein [Blastococcus sp. TML/M2B]|uniref:universal stress protein n=1 Tax=unclassified Blastococcus TaxID=2619396 RepID=UPI00190D755C|nr:MULTISPECIES: universal stress protein [unclassified Blastococcus]MBN1092817.1 universal stress protein [Blastococcus sp. TML/M2B]MBN1097076.1 universal stress protein [Blastococcus sp. TML/C7B]
MTDPTSPAPVVVGLDGSADAWAAAELAAEEARRRGAPVELLFAFPWPEGARVAAPEGFDGRAAMHVMAELVLETAVDTLRRRVPGLTVGSRMHVGAAPDVLVAASRSAQLLCVGSRSSGSIDDVVLGSTASAVARHAACPVLVVPLRAGSTVTGRSGVVVGVDGPEDDPVLDAAFDAAEARDCGLVAVHTWRHPFPGAAHVVLDPLIGADAAQRRQESLLDDLLTSRTTRRPDVPVRRVVEQARAADVLLSAALTAELLVVGRHHRPGGPLGTLRSTTNAVLHRAGCPVEVVPGAGPAEAGRPGAR